MCVPACIGLDIPQADTPGQTSPQADTPLPSACWDTPPAHCMLGYRHPRRLLLRMVRILLECILVKNANTDLDAKSEWASKLCIKNKLDLLSYPSHFSSLRRILHPFLHIAHACTYSHCTLTKGCADLQRKISPKRIRNGSDCSKAFSPIKHKFI